MGPKTAKSTVSKITTYLSNSEHVLLDSIDIQVPLAVQQLDRAIEYCCDRADFTIC